MAGKTIISGSSSSGVTLSDSAYGNPITVTGTINVSNDFGIYYQGGTNQLDHRQPGSDRGILHHPRQRHYAGQLPIAP